MPERKSALTNGKMIAGRFLLFLILFLLFHGVQFWPLGLFLKLWVQILLRSLFLGSPWPPLPHEMVWKHTRFSLVGVSRSGWIRHTRRGRAGGPGVRGPRRRPGRSCGFGLFPSLRLRGFFSLMGPRGGLFSSLSSILRGGGGGGGCGEGEGEGKKENPTSLVVLKEKGLPTLLSLFLPPDFF